MPPQLDALRCEMEEINHPAYYGGDTVYEAIKVIEAWDLGFALGNCLKYIRRHGRKSLSLEAKLQDLTKAEWYLHHEIEQLRVRLNASAPTADTPQTRSASILASAAAVRRAGGRK